MADPFGKTSGGGAGAGGPEPPPAPAAGPRPPRALGSGEWPATPWTLIRGARAADVHHRRKTVGLLLAIYYRPVRRFFARVLALPEETAEELTQGLFATLLERDFIENLRHETSLRGFLKVACRRHVSKWRAAEGTRRRALRTLAEGRATLGPGAVPPDDAALDAELDAELRRSYLEDALERLRGELVRRGKEDVLAVFEARTRFDGSRPEEYRALAERFGKRVYDIRNHLSAARKIFKRELLRVAAERADDPRTELEELGLEPYLR